MDPVQMERRCPGASPLGIARLADHELSFTYDSPTWEGGVATVIPSDGDSVWGVLWSLDDVHVATLDGYEGVPVVYRRAEALVEAEGTPVTALLYIANEMVGTAPSPAYLEGILQGARRFGLPEEYIARISSTPTA